MFIYSQDLVNVTVCGVVNDVLDDLILTKTMISAYIYQTTYVG